MPSGYGIPGDGEYMSWDEMNGRLEQAHNYWVSTTRPDGRPHAMPVWAVWLDGALSFGTDRDSRKARNLASNPEIVVHLESGDEVAILEGAVQVVTDSQVIKAIDAAYKKKYGMKLTEAPGTLSIFSLSPRIAFAWREKDFNKLATRWLF
jgi:general stress protein 26